MWGKLGEAAEAGFRVYVNGREGLMSAHVVCTFASEDLYVSIFSSVERGITGGFLL